jgi:citrate synthase
MHSAVTTGIGTLKGSLHGGANEAVVKLLKQIDENGADPVSYIKGLLAQRAKVPGFGHRVYSTGDPRAAHLRRMSHELGLSSGQIKWFQYSKAIEEFLNTEKKLNANVDFYSASTYHTLGIDVDLFTPIFVVSRIAGWTAHVMEQLADNEVIRPRAEYRGPAYPAPWIPIDERH